MPLAAPSCGCGCASRPEPAVGARGFLSCQGQGQHPGQHPAAPREPLRASWGWCREKEPGTRAVQNIKSGPQPPPPPPRMPGRFPVLRYLRAPFPPPWPCPHRARGWQYQVRRHFCFRGDASPGAQQLRGAAGGAEPGAPTRARGPSLGCSPPPATLPGGCPQPPALGGPTLGVTSFPHGLSKPQPPFRAPSLPRPAGGAGGGWPTTPRGCRCQGCPRPPCQALAGGSCSRDPAASISTGEPWWGAAGAGLGPGDALGAKGVLGVPEGAALRAGPWGFWEAGGCFGDVGACLGCSEH